MPSRRVPKAPAAACRLQRGGGHLPGPVRSLKGTNDLARAAPHGVAIVAQRCQVYLPGQLRDFGAGHPDAEVSALDAEPPEPPVVEDLRARAEDGVHDDVFGACDVPHEPRQGVEVLARAHTHLLIAEPRKGTVRRRCLVARYRDRVHGAVLVEKQLTNIHVSPPIIMGGLDGPPYPPTLRAPGNPARPATGRDGPPYPQCSGPPGNPARPSTSR